MAGLRRAQRRLLLVEVIPAGPRPRRAGPPPSPAPARPIRGLRRCSQLALGAGTLAIAIESVAPFDHGVWLIAYLLLVGSLAPYLLAAGEAALFGSRPVGRAVDAQPALWAVGTIAVPAGVLADSRVLVVLGSAALLAALASMASAGLASRPRRSVSGRGRLEVAYGALVVFMAVSVAVGLTLAWDISWF